MSCVRCIISGHVQGVWFRETTRQKAALLGLTGSAMNLPNGDVEVIACGDAQVLQELQAWLWRGSSTSQVSDVRCESLQPDVLPDAFVTGSTSTYQNPANFACAKNFTVLLTDGEPTRDVDAYDQVPKLPNFTAAMGRSSCTGGKVNGSCLDDIAEYLSKEVRDGLELARKAQLAKRSRLRVHVDDQTYKIVRFSSNSFAVDGDDAPQLRGLVDIYDGGRHLYQALIVATSFDGTNMVFEFKRNTVTALGPALDFERDENAPAGLLPAH